MKLLSVMMVAWLVVACSDDGATSDDSSVDQSTPDASVDLPASETGWPDGAGGDAAAPVSTTIFALTTGTFSKDTQVELPGVIVTAVDSGGKYTGDVYVQDKKGGAGSGLRLYKPKVTSGGKVTDLNIGDEVKVVGKYVQYTGPTSNPFSGGAYVDELTNATVTFIKAGTAATPASVLPANLTSKTTSKGWEHVLVEVKNVQVTEEVNSYGEFKAGGLSVDDELYAHTPKKGDCLDITGVAYFFYFNKLAPRSAADIKTSTGCTGPAKVTIKDIQDTTSTNHPAVGTQVTVAGVITAVDSTKTTSGDYVGFFIQDAAGGPYSGIYVYHSWQDTSTQKPKLAESIELTGTYDEHNSRSELKSVTWTDKGQGTIPAPAAVKAADLVTGGATAESYEGVLVQVSSIEVGAYLTDSLLVQIGFTDATTTLPIVHKLYDFMKPTPPALKTTYKTITGPLTYVASKFQIFPRSAADMVAGP